MSQSSSCILYSAEKQDELRTHSKFKNSFSTLKLKSRSQQSHYKSTGLPQLVHNPREIKPRQVKQINTIKFIRSKLSGLNAAHNVLVVDEKMVQKIKSSFQIKPIPKILHQCGKPLDFKRYSMEPKHKCMRSNHNSFNKTKMTTTPIEIKGWAQKQTGIPSTFFEAYPYTSEFSTLAFLN